SLNDQAQEMLRKWEAGDEHVRDLWQRMNAWAFEGFEATYRLFGVTFDKQYYESELYTKGKEIVNDGLARGIFAKRDDGAVVVDLEEEKLGQKVLLRSDGTAVYIVQDLYLAGLKNTEYNFDRSVYVVGNEQEYHFKVLAQIFRKLGFPIADKLYHLSYGMVELPEGKMKSREGTVVDADDIINDTRDLAREEVASRYDLTGDELEERSLKIALAAIKYTLLKIDTAKNMVFNPKQAISFEGDTGPYLLYSYARASSILRKLDGEPPFELVEPNEYEARLVKALGRFPEVVKAVHDRLTPSLLAAYAFTLAQVFNEFYHNCPVIKSDRAGFRVALVKALRSVLKDCINLLGIEEIEEM
ncbi:MAG: arginine--tRNA ligase, partial [Chitinivibrionales bacterium]|nr:arginine--tRNA ligase [Chitinivibrionales bacterium]